MTKLLTCDDLGKLGKTKLDKMVMRMEKFGARFGGYGHGVALAPYRERNKRKLAERQVKALGRERDALVADMGLLQEDAQEGFAADRKCLEDQVKEALNDAKLTREKLQVVGAKLKDAETANKTLSARVRLLEEQLAAVPSLADVVEDYRATPMYRQDLDDNIAAFRASVDFEKVVGAESRKMMPLVVDCCWEFLKDDLRRPRDGFETFFLEWMRANQSAQASRGPGTQP